ncbi:hypothetical protein Sjap_012040 [Stephania japonica]|uniref:Pectinesterase n=1 Tax=Stephania japonica TaxID=461633 RepID=A0AAP0JEJ3_9MAGN
MAFQDFDYLSNRRHAEKQEKLKKRIIIAVVVILIVLAVIAAVAAYVFVYRPRQNHESSSTHHDHNSSSKTNDSEQTTDAPAPLPDDSGTADEAASDEDSADAAAAPSNTNSTTTTDAAAAPSNDDTIPKNENSLMQEGVKAACAITDYKETCESRLTKAVGSNSSADPKDLFKGVVSAILDEVDPAFNQSLTFLSDDPKIKSAIEDCQLLLRDTKKELGLSMSNVNDGEVTQISSKAPDLNNWLSAVMSYQQACIDGFPEGELRTKMKDSMKTAKELTSNALAIVSQFSSIKSMLQIPGLPLRRLLGSKRCRNSNSIDKEGTPSWMTREQRRMLKGQPVNLKPNVVVAKDGSGDFKTISDALAKIPPKFDGQYVIYVKEGIYNETVVVEMNMENITMYGDGSQKTIVTGSKNFVDGVGTFRTASFAALGDGFIGKALGFRNTAGPEKHQAVALRVQSDRSVFVNCRMEGYQDTLYVQTHRQFYRSCVIAGTVDFIFGDAAVIFQNCLIVVRKPLDGQQNIVTAQGRSDGHETTGIVIQNCKIQPDEKLISEKSKIKSYLGRPWKEYSRTIIMESTIDDLINAAGWLPWEGDFALQTLYYAEYNNNGPGADVTARVNWAGYKKSITKDEASNYTVGPFLQGENWVKDSGTQVHLGLFT